MGFDLEIFAGDLVDNYKSPAQILGNANLRSGYQGMEVIEFSDRCHGDHARVPIQHQRMADSKSAGSEVLHTDTNGYSKKSSLSLQEAFLNFRKRRMVR